MPKTYEPGVLRPVIWRARSCSSACPIPTMKIELPMIEVFGRGGSLKSSWYGDCLPLMTSRCSSTCRLTRAFVSETIGLEDVEEAFHRMERGEVLRSVVVL